MAEVGEVAWWGASAFGVVMVVWRTIARWARLGSEVDRLRREVARLSLGEVGRKVSVLTDQVERARSPLELEVDIGALQVRMTQLESDFESLRFNATQAAEWELRTRGGNGGNGGGHA